MDLGDERLGARGRGRPADTVGDLPIEHRREITGTDGAHLGQEGICLRGAVIAWVEEVIGAAYHSVGLHLGPVGCKG